MPIITLDMSVEESVIMMHALQLAGLRMAEFQRGCVGRGDEPGAAEYQAKRDLIAGKLAAINTQFEATFAPADDTRYCDGDNCQRRDCELHYMNAPLRLAPADDYLD